MDEMNACFCGFTTKDANDFNNHVAVHERQHHNHLPQQNGNGIDDNDEQDNMQTYNQMKSKIHHTKFLQQNKPLAAETFQQALTSRQQHSAETFMPTEDLNGTTNGSIGFGGFELTMLNNKQFAGNGPTNVAEFLPESSKSVTKQKKRAKTQRQGLNKVTNGCSGSSYNYSSSSDGSMNSVDGEGIDRTLFNGLGLEEEEEEFDEEKNDLEEVLRAVDHHHQQPSQSQQQNFLWPLIAGTHSSSDEHESNSGVETSGSTNATTNTPSVAKKQQCRRNNKKSGSRSTGNGSGKLQLSCPHCTFVTFMSQHMNSHLKAHETCRENMFTCDICGVEFSQKANMHRHRGTHSGHKPYECPFCQKRFFRKDQMQEHSMTHIKMGNDFDCPVGNCLSRFTAHAALRSHLEQDHTITPSVQATCKRCPMAFANSRRLLLHYQTKHEELLSLLARTARVVNLGSNGTANADLMVENEVPSTSSAVITGRGTVKRRIVRAEQEGCGAKKNGRTQFIVDSLLQPAPLAMAKSSAGSSPTSLSTLSPYNVDDLPERAAAVIDQKEDNFHTPNQFPQQNWQNIVAQQQQQQWMASIVSAAAATNGINMPIPPSASSLPISHFQSVSNIANLILQKFCETTAQTNETDSSSNAFPNGNIDHEHQQQKQQRPKKKIGTKSGVKGNNIATTKASPTSVQNEQQQPCSSSSMINDGFASNKPFLNRFLPITEAPDYSGLLMTKRPFDFTDNCRKNTFGQRRNSVSAPLIFDGTNEHSADFDATSSGSNDEERDGAKNKNEEANCKMDWNTRNMSQISGGSSSKRKQRSPRALTLSPLLPTNKASSPSLNGNIINDHHEPTDVKEQKFLLPTEKHTIKGGDNHKTSSYTNSTSSSQQHSASSTSSAELLPGQPPNMLSTGMRNSAENFLAPFHQQQPFVGHQDFFGGGNNNGYYPATMQHAYTAAAAAGAAPCFWLNVMGSKLGSATTPPTIGGCPSEQEILWCNAQQLFNAAFIQHQTCSHCGIYFLDRSLYLEHKSLHSESDPFRCSLCGCLCVDKHMFNAHLIGSNHGGSGSHKNKTSRITNMGLKA